MIMILLVMKKYVIDKGIYITKN